MGAGDSRLIKMSAPGTLFKTIRKSLPEDNTFLIAFDATTVAAHAFFLITSSASTHRTLTQDTLSKMSYRLRVKPFCNRGRGNVVSAIMKFVGFLTTDT
jgi:hypothetical protein